MTRILVLQHPGAETTDFDAVLAAARPTFSDAIHVRRRPGLFIGVASFWTEPEDEGTSGLAEDPERGLVLAWDGRIDARADLCRELAVLPSTPSAELALRAFRRWGTRAPEHMLGDFAMVVVEHERQRIFAARDAFGLRSLVHARHRGGRVIASDERLLFAIGVGREPDVEALARFISRVYVPVADTLYRDIRNVPSGGTLEIDGERESARRYFQPNVDEEALADHEHVERIRAALTVAVADRSRGRRPISSDASGGVDSSTVVALLAARLRAEGRAPPLLLHMRCVGMPCDEGRYAQALARHVGAPLVEVDGAQVRFGPAGIPELDVPDSWCEPTHELLAEAHRRGVRVSFSGQGSDELQFRFLLVEDALVTHAWLDAARFAGLFDQPFSRSRWSGLLRAGARVVAPQDWLRRRSDRRLPDQLPSWLAPKGRQLALDGARAMAEFPRSYRNKSPLRRASYAELLFSPPTTMLAQAESGFARAHGIELAIPYCDQRVVRAFAALPTRMRASFDLPKPTLREIARDLLPPSLAWKYPGVDYAPFLHAAWRRASDEWLALAAAPRLAALGLVDPPKLRAAVEKGFKKGELAWDLHPVLRGEAWLRRLGQAEK
jgi:asparagine synthase (glutamine-hydrolysing)